MTMPDDGGGGGGDGEEASPDEGGDGGSTPPHTCEPSIGSSAEQVALQDELDAAASADGIAAAERHVHRSPWAAKPAAVLA